MTYQATHQPGQVGLRRPLVGPTHHIGAVREMRKPVSTAHVPTPPGLSLGDGCDSPPARVTLSGESGGQPGIEGEQQVEALLGPHLSYD